jgi:hypothetical protein
MLSCTAEVTPNNFTAEAYELVTSAIGAG